MLTALILISVFVSGFSIAWLIQDYSAECIKSQAMRLEASQNDRVRNIQEWGNEGWSLAHARLVELDDQSRRMIKLDEKINIALRQAMLGEGN